MKTLRIVVIFLLIVPIIIAQETSVPSQVIIPEEPSTETSPSSSQSGGNGGNNRREITQDFSVMPDIIKITLKQGAFTTKTLEVFNTGNTNMNVEIIQEDLENFLLISEKSFTLKKRELKTITLDFFSSSDQPGGIYLGQLIVQSGKIKKIVDIVVEIQEREAIFDLKIGIKEKNKLRGENLDAAILIDNLGDLRPVDITLSYAFKNMENQDIFLQQETLAIEEQLKFVKTFQIPHYLKTGNYIFYVKLTYQNQIVFGSDVFTVIEEQQPKGGISYSYLIIILFLLLGIFAVLMVKKRKRKSPRKNKK